MMDNPEGVAVFIIKHN